jgi:hypothetical protein
VLSQHPGLLFGELNDSVWMRRDVSERGLLSPNYRPRAAAAAELVE